MLTAFICLMLILPAHVRATEPLPDCDIKKSAALDFTDAVEMDVLTVKIAGSPCHAGTIMVSIRQPDGSLVYEFSSPFKRFVAVEWDDPGLDKDAERVADYLSRHAYAGKSSELPDWEEPMLYYENNMTNVAVTKEQYERLRAADLPVFYHQTYYEGGRHIVFDPSKQQAVIVMEGGG